MISLKKYALVLIAVAMVGLTSCKEEKVEEAPVVRPIKTFTISAKQTFSQRKFPGRANASQEATLAFEVAGKLKEFPVNVGDVVKKGDVLAALDTRDFESALTSSKAEVKRAKAQYERVKKAAAMNAVSRQDLSDALASYESAKARVEIREKSLEDATITAPYDAIVVANFFENFEAVQPKQPVVRIVNPTEIEMVVDIPEDLIGYVTDGAEVFASFDALPNVELSAKVTEIGNEASSVTRTYPVTITMKQPDSGSKILPGMTGNAWSAKKETDAHDTAGFEVPITAIGDGVDDVSFVWVLDESSMTVSKREVKTGQLTKNGILIVKGLSGGEVIAAAGVELLKEGQVVRIFK